MRYSIWRMPYCTEGTLSGLALFVRVINSTRSHYKYFDCIVMLLLYCMSCIRNECTGCTLYSNNNLQ